MQTSGASNWGNRLISGSYVRVGANVDVVVADSYSTSGALAIAVRGFLVMELDGSGSAAAVVNT